MRRRGGGVTARSLDSVERTDSIVVRYSATDEGLLSDSSFHECWSSRRNAWQGKPKYSEKTCRSVALSTKNPTMTDPGSNPGHRDGKPATNRLCYCKAFIL
jgi:hypothetical protein